MPVQFRHKDKDYSYKLTPDCEPFALVYANSLYRFCLVEIDCGSEPLRASNKDRQAIELKFQAYLSLLSTGAYQQWGVENCTVLFTTTTQVRMQNMIQLLETMTLDYLPCFAFACFPTQFQTNPQPPHGWPILAPWHRGKNVSLTLGVLS